MILSNIQNVCIHMLSNIRHMRVMTIVRIYLHPTKKKSQANKQISTNVNYESRELDN